MRNCRRINYTSLELIGDNVDDDTMALLFRHKHLKELHIVGARQVTNAGLTYIENLRNLEWLNLDGVAITDRGLFFLQQMTRLRGLQLTNAFLTGCGLEHLLALKTLEYLDLDGTNVDDKGMEVLAKIKSLKTLRLTKTAITDKGARKLQRMKKLRTLILYHSHVSEECVTALRKRMPMCEIKWTAYESPKPIPAKLPKLFTRQEKAELDPGWYLKLIDDTNKIKIEQRRWFTPKPESFLKGSSFKVSQPSWFELLDWKIDP
ncbi:MAG: hypothetical protein HYX67_15725 [Candidatus Melainabacteria bacterium]|nr:hypothetical protein [Candidatus Melainabacteria bacterium]